MKIKLIALMFFFVCYCFNISNLNAITVNPDIEKKSMESLPIDFTKKSRKEIEKKIGRKLKFKERISFWLLKRQQKKWHELKEVEVKLMDGRMVKGNFLKIENDQLYLVDSRRKEMDIYTNPDDLLVIPLSNVDTISTIRKKLIFGVLSTLLLFYLGLLATGLASQNRHLLTDKEFKSRRNGGILLFILGVFAGILTLISAFPKKLNIKGDPKNYHPKKGKKFKPYPIDEQPRKEVMTKEDFGF